MARDPVTGLEIGTFDPNALPPANTQLPNDPINSLAIGGVIDPTAPVQGSRNALPLDPTGLSASGPIIYNSYSGVDIVASVTLPGESPITLGELQTISYSIHRENTPIRFVGHTNVMGFVRGPRTIAGSLVFTVFEEYAFYRLQQFKQARFIGITPLADMLPPFDVTLSFANEYGSFSRLRILGITIVDEGGTMSIDDMLTESTYTYMARGFIPLTSYSPPEVTSLAVPSQFRRPLTQL